jgi:hypothetical protein
MTSRTYRYSRFLPCLLLLLSLLSATLSAAEPARDIRIVVDMSGSMKKNDPQLLRQPAVRLLADLLPKGTQAGVWTFGKYVNMLVPLKPVTDEWRSMAKTRAADINSIAAFTNIGEAIETATVGWQQPDANSERHLILLTDGWVDISASASDNHQARQAILNTQLPHLKNNGVKFHTLALADDVDKELLKLLASSTQGSYHQAHSADDLLKVFVNAFDQSVKPQQVPIEEDGFSIDAGINEFTALIFKKNTNSKTVELITPQGKRLNAQQKDSDVKWLADAKFDLITVSQPNAGKWQLVADLDPSSRVTIISDLSLQVKGLPAMAEVGGAIDMQISLTEKGKTIVRQDFLRLLDIEVKHQQGEDHHSKTLSRYSDPKNNIPDDGLYHFQLEDKLAAGEHHFSIEVDGQTFKRVYKQTLQVAAPAKKNDAEKDPHHPTAEPTPEPTAAPSAPHAEDDDNFNKPASEFESDNFAEAEDTSHDESGVLTAEDPEPDGMEKPHDEAPTATATPAAHEPAAKKPISQQPWFKWAIAGSIVLANLLLFTIGIVWYRRASKRRQAEDQLEDESLQEKPAEEKPIAEEKPKAAENKKTEPEKTPAATPEPETAEPMPEAKPEATAIDEGEILEDPLKDLHADDFDNDLDMPDEDKPA